jgi:hypothetical protein
MVFSLYRLEALMTLTMVFFGLNFFYVLWGMAFWVDNHLVNTITPIILIKATEAFFMYTCNNPHI